eukprot:9378398-Pyramimonas_sp.AAC.1
MSRPRWLHNGYARPQDGPEGHQQHPRRPQTILRRPRDSPMTPHDGPGQPQEGPKVILSIPFGRAW